MILKVATDDIIDKKTGKKRKATYSDVKYDLDKWADATKFMPADFDLVYIKSPTHIKTISGWSTGKKWDGATIKPEEKVTHWKRHE